MISQNYSLKVLVLEEQLEMHVSASNTSNASKYF